MVFCAVRRIGTGLRLVALPTLVALIGLAVSGAGGVTAQVGTSAGPTPAPPERWPTDLAVSPLTDDVYVAFELNQHVERLRFGVGGGRRDAWRAPLLYPGYDVSVNASTGNVFEPMVRSMLEISHQSDRGNLLHRWTTGFVGRATDLAVDDASNDLSVGLLSANQVDVHTFVQSGDDLTLRQVTSTGLADPIASIAVDTAGNVLAVGSVPGGGGKVQSFDDQGTRLGEWPVDGRPLAVAVGADSVIVACQEGAGYLGAIHRFAPDGAEERSWPLYGRPLDVDVAPNDEVWVSLQRGPGIDIAVEHYSYEGTLLLRWTAVSRLFLPAVSRG